MISCHEKVAKIFLFGTTVSVRSAKGPEFIAYGFQKCFKNLGVLQKLSWDLKQLRASAIL